MSVENEVAITYEKLYELLRFEKSSDELQAMDSSFFADLLLYLKEKEKIYINARNKVDLFSMAERDNVQIQLSNIRRIIKELYERREKKVITMAINKSRTQSSLIDTSNMLSEEKLLFNSLVGELDFFRQGILHNLFLLKHPSIEGKGIITNSPKMSSAADFANQASEFGVSQDLSANNQFSNDQSLNNPFSNNQSLNDQSLSNQSSNNSSTANTSIRSSSTINSSMPNLPNSNSSIISDDKTQISPALAQSNSKIESEESSTNNTILVKFTKSMPQLVGEELELYGPFEPEDEAKLPCEIAKLVISEGSAVEC